MFMACWFELSECILCKSMYYILVVFCYHGIDFKGSNLLNYILVTLLLHELLPFDMLLIECYVFFYFHSYDDDVVS